ncbi:MAG: FimB/Mfa2 family fimbrial subunit [Dysgonamonadaceae bacterium]|jgi:hypothetical protein|nr:FimB/Mfa2 family fimbrial subunit [Dysgonamonadaceae bacterium]
MKKLVYYIGALACIVFSLFSCIQDDLSICKPDGIIPQFILVPYEGNNIINDSLYSATLCVFDEQDHFIASYQIPGRPELNKTYTPDWGLSPGTYHFSMWLNYHKVNVEPCIIGKTMRHDTMIRLAIPDSKIVDDPGSIPFLCHGRLENEEVSEENQLFTIPVMQLTNKINLRVTGLKQAGSFLRASAAESDDYLFSIEDNNGYYRIGGDFGSGSYFTYSTNKRIDSDTLDASLTVLKLSATRFNPTISFRNLTTRKQLFSEDLTNSLIQLILSEYPDNDFDKNHDYYIEINSSPEKEITVTVTINGWIDNKSDHELDIN